MFAPTVASTLSATHLAKLTELSLRMRSSVFWHVMLRRLWLPTFRGSLSVRSWMIKQSKKTAGPLKMGAIDCPETSVPNYQSTLRKMPEDRRSHFHRSGSLMYIQILTESGLSRISLPAVFSRSLRMLVAVPDCLLATKWTAVCILGCKLNGCSRQTCLLASHKRSRNMQVC